MMPNNVTTNGATRKAPSIMANPYAKKRKTPAPTSTTSASTNVENNGTKSTAHAPGSYRYQANARPSTATGRTIPAAPVRHENNTQRNFSASYSQASNTGTTSTVSERQVSSSHQLVATSKQTSSDNKRESIDSLDDGTIDWDEAIRVADTATASVLSSSQSMDPPATATSTFSQGTSNHNLSLLTGPTSPTKNQRVTETAFSASSPVVDLTQSNDSEEPLRPTNAANATTSNQELKIPSVSNPYRSPSKKPPLVPMASGRQHHNNMASLRPAAWSNNGATAVAGQQGSQKVAASPKLTQQQLTQQGRVVSSPSAHLHPTIAMLPKELRFSPDAIQPIKDGRTPELIKHASLSQPLANGWTLFDHQKRAICLALRMRRCILALDMGLGKTLIGCVWARSFQRTFPNCKVIVICPVSLKEEWERTAKKATEIVVENQDKKPKAKPKKKRKGEAEAPSSEDNNDENSDDNSDKPKLEIFSWAKVPTDIKEESYIVVCDEAHAIQSATSARTKELLKLVQPQRCIGVLLLTGTPMKNGKPQNLFPLLRAVKHPLGRNQRAYETQFCAGREKRFGRGPPIWDANGSSNLPQLRELVLSHMLHLKKDDCLTLPPATRELKHVPVSHRDKLKFENDLKDLRRLAAAQSTKESDNNDALLGAMTQLRCTGAFARVDATVDIAKKILEVEPAIVLFTSFVKVANAIHKKLAASGWTGELMTGETPPKKRQEMVDNFQAGVSPVFVCTFGVGSTGLTLTAARSVILVDRPWTPGDTHQAENRIRRIGQMHPVKFIWVSSFEIDKHVDDLLYSKTQTSNAVLMEEDSEGSSAAATSRPKKSILQLLLARIADDDTSQNTGTQPGSSGPSLSQTSIHSYYGKP